MWGVCTALHKHGSFNRWREVEGERRESVQRYICPRCRRTWSEIPAGLMPYRSMEVDRMEQLVRRAVDRQRREASAGHREGSGLHSAGMQNSVETHCFPLRVAWPANAGACGRGHLRVLAGHA